MSNKTRKRIWPVSVVAVIGMVAILAALAATALMPAVSQAQGAPPPALPPDGLVANATSASEISLSWNAGLLQTAYELQRKEGAGSYSTVSDTITVTSYTDTGLTAGTEYTYRVRGVSAGGESTWSNEATATTETVPPQQSPHCLRGRT